MWLITKAVFDLDVIAGHETTAIALAFACFLLAVHPHAQQKLVGELGRVLGDCAATVADLPDLRYTDCVIKETLRLYPPAWAINREVVAECAIGGYLPRGARNSSFRSGSFTATGAGSPTPRRSSPSGGRTIFGSGCPAAPISSSESPHDAADCLFCLPLQRNRPNPQRVTCVQ